MDARQELEELRRLDALEAKAAGSRAQSRPLPANAGLAKLATSVAGMPVDTVENVLNLGLAGAGTVATALGRPDMAPDLIRGSVGGSEHLEGLLRKTGAPGLSPDNPAPGSKTGTAQYDFVARGGVIPGGAIPAAASIVAEKIGGPAWAPVGALAPGAAGQAAREVAARMPKPSAEAQLLQSEGVQLTPGQRLGGGVKRMEDAATSIPGLGDAIKGAHRRGFEQFNEAAANRALAPIGDRLPNGLKGNAAVEYVYGKLGDAYDALLPNLKGDLHARAPARTDVESTGTAVTTSSPITANRPGPAGMSLSDELAVIKQMGENLPEPQRGQLSRIIDNEVVNRFTTHGKASGEVLKDIESKLGVLSKGFRRSENYDIRTLGGGVEEVQNALRRMIERANPEYQGELAKVNEGYSNFKRVQNAASNVGAQDGVYTPAQLHRSVRAADTSKDKARFAEGNALMQDLSAAGKAVLPSAVPDSGTPFRAAVMYALSHPAKAAALGLPLGAASLAYTPLGQRAFQEFMKQRELKSLPPSSGPLQAILSQQEQ